jgi:ligand-binding SRPBCC domain-containing protein
VTQCYADAERGGNPRHVAMGETVLTFCSELRASPERVWNWITSVDGISRELWPILRMTIPAHLRTLEDAHIEPGRRLFRSWVLLFGVLPIDRSDLTLLRLDHGKGFFEESPMLSMRLWRHERWIEASGDGSVLTDRLAFAPRFAAGVTRWFIRTVFTHRHAVLRRELGDVRANAALSSARGAV